MMYSEFVEAVGCKETDYNYQVFKNLEIMYMNSDLSKQTIYEYGKKLVCNGLTDEQKEFNRKLKSDIDDLKHDAMNDKAQIEIEKINMITWREDKSVVKSCKERIAYYRAHRKELNRLIEEKKNLLYK